MTPFVQLGRRLTDLCDEMEVLTSMLNVSFALVKWSAKEVADDLAKRGVGKENLVIEIVNFVAA